MTPTFILASSSPRRKELLQLIGIQPRILVPSADESMRPGENVESFLRRVTIAKGEAVYNEDYFRIPIVSSDTIVLCDNEVMGKPRNREDAAAFLRKLASNTHEVWTGIAIRYRGRCRYDFTRTEVEFGPISEDELTYYLENENYMDKAGAYAIQGMASVFVKKINGCYFNVMGFPLNMFYNMLKGMDISIYS